MNDYFALDVETANTDYSSICQIGIAHFRDGKLNDKWSTLVNPKTYFDPYNVDIHGIEQSDVEGAPEFKDVFSKLNELLAGNTIIHHGHFDRTAFARCYDRFDLQPIECEWLDNTKVVRRTWDEFSARGYNLKNLVENFGVELDHHDALSDAIAAGQIFALALTKSGKTVADWTAEVRKRVYKPQDFRRDGDTEAPFFGERIVFTGELDVKRSVAADIAQQLGFDVQNGVNKKTTYICIGLQDLSTLAGHPKSSKHRKAETLAKEGQEIAFLSEDDFWAIAKTHTTGEVE